MDDKIIGLYAAGLSTRDIRAHLEEVYGLKVSADLVSRVACVLHHRAHIRWP
jgi:putative transposase